MAYSSFHTLKIDHFKVPSDLTDFPVYVDVTHPTLKTVANGGNVQSSSGFDIGFSSDSAGTALYKWEVENYDGINGRIRAHIKVPAVSSTVTTTFYLPYNDATIVTDLSDPINVWTNSFISVYHLKDGTTLSVLDSRNVNNGTNHGATATTGLINGGALMVGASSQYIDLGTAIVPTAITYSALIKLNSLTSPGTYLPVISRTNVGTTIFTLMDVRNNGKMACYAFGTGNSFYDNTGIATLSIGVWYHVAMTYDSTNGIKGFVNGILDGSNPPQGALNTTALNTYLGNDPNTASRFFDGIMDEPRIASVGRAPGWVTAEANNQLSPSTFIYFDTDPPLSRAIIDAGTGYSTVADWFDTTPQPDHADSGASLETLVGYSSFLPPSFATFPGRLIETGTGSKESWGIFGE